MKKNSYIRDGWSQKSIVKFKKNYKDHSRYYTVIFEYLFYDDSNTSEMLEKNGKYIEITNIKIWKLIMILDY